MAAYAFNPFTGNFDLNTASASDVLGPASSTDKAIARFSGTTGKLIQNSSAIIDDSGRLALTATGAGDAGNFTSNILQLIQNGVYFSAGMMVINTKNYFFLQSYIGGSGNGEGPLVINPVGNELIFAANGINGKMGIGTYSPTARLHIMAGDASANDAPLKFTAGVNLTTPEAGAVEFDGTNLYYTDSTPTRQTLATQAYVASSSPVLSVAGHTGVVTLAQADISGLTTTDSPTFNGLTITNNAVMGGYLRVGSTSAPANTTAGDITALRMSIGSNTALSTDVVLINSTINSSSVNYRGLRAAPTFTGSGASPAGIEAHPTFNPSATVSFAYGLINIALGSPSTGIAINNLYGGLYRIDTGSNGGTVGSAAAINAASPSLGSTIPSTTYGLLVGNQGAASVTTSIGVDIAAQTSSGTTIGLRIALPTGSTAYALQLSDTGGTAAGGITFGTDVQIFRGAANALRVSPASDSSDAFSVINAAKSLRTIRVDTQNQRMSIGGNTAPSTTLHVLGTTTTTNLALGGSVYFSSEISDGNSGTSKTIDWTAGNNHSVTLTGNCTFTFTAPSGPAHLTLRVIGNGSAFTVTFPAAVKGLSGYTPTSTLNSWDIISLYYDGTNYSSAVNQNYS